MATVQLTGDLGLDASAQLAPFSSLLKYFQQLPAMRVNNEDFSKAAGLTLDQPALTAVSTGLSFDKDVTAGPNGEVISVSAGAHGLLALIPRTPAVTSLPDVIAGDVAIAAGTCYVAFGMQAAVGASASIGDLLQFGVSPGQSMDIRNYQSFPLAHNITLLDAVKQTVGNFVIPGKSDDLSSLPDGCVATVGGSGSLKLSATANLLAVTNPLASAELPDPLPALSVTEGGTVQVGASLELQCSFQICAQKVSPGHVRVGWYRQRGTDFAVQVSVSEQVSAGFGTTDVFAALIGAISSSASTDLEELQKAGLSADQIDAIQDAVTAAVNRKLELAVSAEIGSSDQTGTLFLYDVDLSALTDDSRRALDAALRGDLSGLHAETLPGISTVQSVWEKTRSSRTKLEVNLLGIVNVGMISTLTATGEVLVEQATGALVISDKLAAERFRSTAMNFGADTQKLRHVLAESFLVTATYKGMQRQVGGPSLTCSHDFFDLQNDTSVDDMVQELRVGSAFGLFSSEDATPPAGVSDFGKTMIHATAAYDSGVAQTLFLGPGNAPIPPAFYENAGRAAIRLLVGPGDVDAVRLQPATNDELWSRMKALGQPGIASLLPHIAAPLLGAVTADYSVIMWWATAMAGASLRLSAIRKWFEQHPAADRSDPEFQKLRQDLAGHLKQVAATTSEEFGKPWGLIAMDQASGRRANASLLIAGPKLVRTKQRELAAAVASIQQTD